SRGRGGGPAPPIAEQSTRIGGGSLEDDTRWTKFVRTEHGAASLRAAGGRDAGRVRRLEPFQPAPTSRCVADRVQSDARAALSAHPNRPFDETEAGAARRRRGGLLPLQQVQE